MTKVDTLLKNTRIELGYELAEVSKKTKLPLKYLKAFEESDSRCYPHEPYCSLVIKDYADFLGLNGQEIVRLFRRDFIQKNDSKNIPLSTHGITPKYLFTLVVTIVIAFFITYLVNEYLRFSKPPQLEVSWPKLLTSNVVEISGHTSTDATVRINRDLVIVNSDGSFSKKLTLDSSSTKVVVESKSPGGKSTIIEKTLTPVSH